MASEEVDFLRDQVQRLNAVLAQYQEKYPPVELSRQESALSSQGPRPPWLTDRSLLSPLLIEYDANIHTLKVEVEQHKEEQKDMRSQINKLIAENKRLMRELKETVQSQIHTFDDGEVGPAPVVTGDTTEDEQVIANLQHQLEMAVQEKESAMEMWQAGLQEVERLERALQDKQYDPQLRALEHQASQIKGQYVKTVSDLNTEMSNLQDELKRSKTELKASNVQVTDLRATLEEMRQQVMRKERERADAMEREESSDVTLVELQRKIADLETQMFNSVKEANQFRNEKTHLEQKVTELQKKCTDHEHREYEAVLQVRDSVQMVENAMLEKDQALIREQQKEEQSSKLQEALNQLLNEAGIRTRQEVDSVKKQCNNNISRLMDEIHTLEMDNSEKQAQLERALREKRAVESELEKIYQEGLIQGSKDSGNLDELNRRACQAERSRDEALGKLEALQNSNRRNEMNQQQQKSQLEARVSQLQDRITTMNIEFESVNDDRLKFLGEIDELKRKLQSARQEKESAERKFNKDMSCFEQDQQLKQREYEVKLQSIEDSHRHAMGELRTLLTSQQRMSAKWKEECNTITHKFETKMSELRSEVSRHKKRNEELLSLLNETKEKTAQSEQMLSEYTRNIKRLEERVRESENRAASATQQITRQMTRERQVLSDRRHLQREVDRNRKNTSRPGFRISENIGISDLGRAGSPRLGAPGSVATENANGNL